MRNKNEALNSKTVIACMVLAAILGSPVLEAASATKKVVGTKRTAVNMKAAKNISASPSLRTSNRKLKTQPNLRVNSQEKALEKLLAQNSTVSTTGSAGSSTSTSETSPSNTTATSASTGSIAAVTTSASSQGTSSVSLSAAAPAAKPKFTGGWLGILSAEREVENDGTEEKANTSSSKMTGIMGVRLGYNLTEKFKMTFGMNATFTSGTVLVSEESKGKPTDNKVAVMDATAGYKFSDHFSVKAGIMRQFLLLHSPVVMGKAAFPTARLQVTTGEKDDNKLELIAQAAVPTTTNISTKTREEEMTPSMISAAIGATAKLSVFELSAKVSGYQIANLSSATAKESLDGGNSIVTRVGSKPDEVIYGFKTGFRGMDGSLGLGANLTKSLKYNLGGSYSKNLEAGEGLGVGTKASTSLEITLSDDLVVEPSYSQFKIEPDVTVAGYGYHGVNKMGYEAGLKFKIAKLFNISLYGSETDMVYIKSDKFYGRSYGVSIDTELIPF